MRTTPFRILFFAALVILLASCGAFPTAFPQIDPSSLAVSDPVRAEDAFFAVAQRVKNHIDKLPAGTLASQEADFKAAARETWRGIESWKAGGSDTAYQDAWVKMLGRAFIVEVAARRK